MSVTRKQCHGKISTSITYLDARISPSYISFEKGNRDVSVGWNNLLPLYVPWRVVGLFGGFDQ